MVKKVLLIDSQKIIFLMSLYFVTCMHFLFFTKLYGFASLENNTTIIVTSPFILFLLLVLVLNIVLLVTHKHSFKTLLFILLFVSALSSYFMNTFGTIIDKDMKDKKEMLEALKSDEYSHDNIFHTVLGFFGVSTKEYNKDLDIF